MTLDRIALISDVHGNLTALEAVLADIDARGGMPQLEGYTVELRDGVYRGNLAPGETPDYHRRPRTPASA